MRIADNVAALVGNTPLLKLSRLSERSGALILGKCEFMNPTGSVKDRIGHGMIEEALRQGLIGPDTVIIEPTSGNTGIALASAAAACKLKLILTMPSSMSVERQKVLRALGAQIELTPPELGMRGAVDRALELAAATPGSFVPQQFENPANPAVHRATTAEEIWRDTEGKVDIFVAAVGTGGTLTGTGEALKAKNPAIQIIAVEPSDSPVLSGGTAGPHKIQGIGAGFVPKILNTALYGEVIRVGAEEAMNASHRLAKEEGIFVGISAGANLHAAFMVAARPENRGKMVVTVLCDTGERYLSTTLFDEGKE